MKICEDKRYNWNPPANTIDKIYGQLQTTENQTKNLNWQNIKISENAIQMYLKNSPMIFKT